MPPERRLDEADLQRVGVLEREAWTAYRRGDLRHALAAAERALRLNPRAALGRAVRASCWFVRAQRQRPSELRLARRAEGEMLLARRLAPREPAIARLHAELLERAGHAAKAAAVLDELLAAGAGDLATRRLAARLHYEAGRERAARPLLVAVVDADPRDTQARYRLSWCYLRLAASERDPEERGRWLRQAVASFDRYTVQVPEDPDGWIGAARARLEMLEGRSEIDPAALEAIVALYDRAVEVAPDSPDPWFGKGVVFERAGRTRDAAAAYRRALVLRPGHTPALLNLTALLDAMGERTEARRLAARALVSHGLRPDERRRLRRYLAAPETVKRP